MLHPNIFNTGHWNMKCPARIGTSMMAIAHCTIIFDHAANWLVLTMQILCRRHGMESEESRQLVAPGHKKEMPVLEVLTPRHGSLEAVGLVEHCWLLTVHQ